MEPILYGLPIVFGLATTVSVTFLLRSEAKVRDAAKKIARIKEENESLIKRSEASGTADASRLRDLEKEVGRLATANKDLTGRVAELGKKNETLTLTLTKAETSVKETRAAAEKAEAAAAKARAEVAATASPAAEVAQAKAALVAAETERDAAQTALARAEAGLTAARDEQTATQTALEGARAELEGVRAELAQIRTELQSSVADREKIEAEQDARFVRLQDFAEKQVSKLQQENRDLKAGVASAEAKAAAAEAAAASATVVAAPATSPAASPVLDGEVKRSLRYLRSVVALATEGIALLDGKGNILAWNPSAQKMFGYAENEAKGKPLAALLVPDDRTALTRTLNAAGQGSTSSDTVHVIEVLSVRRDGSTFPVEASLDAWRAAEGDDSHFTVTFRDLTERRRNEDMRRAKEAADEANRAKSQFLANMSHELRTPLNAIIGFSEILHDRTFGDLTPKQDRYVGNILTSGRHLLQLINDILDLSKVEAGHVELEYVAFPVGVAVRNIDSLVRALLSKKNVTLEIVVPTDLPVLIADQGKFKQVLYNLVSNAIKFTPEGGKVTIEASPMDNGAALQVAVRDTGIGIKKEDQERIFREFEQVDSSYARTQQGTGLGLALTRRFVHMHGGRIWVESEGEGKGTTFFFTIPFVPDEEKPAGQTGGDSGSVSSTASPTNGSATASMGASAATATTVATAPTAETATKPIILVVDDDQGASELLTHHLGIAGYTISRAFTGADAVLLARELNPSVITLDVQLPDCEGYEVLAELKKDPATRHIPVLMVSIIEDRDRAQALGAAECFVKPVLKDRLLAAISREITGQKDSTANVAEVSSPVNGATPRNGSNGNNGSNGSDGSKRGGGRSPRG